MDLFTNLLDTHAKVMKAEQSLSIETFSDAARSMHTLTQSKAIPELRLTFNDTDTEGLFFWLCSGIIVDMLFHLRFWTGLNRGGAGGGREFATTTRQCLQVRILIGQAF